MQLTNEKFTFKGNYRQYDPRGYAVSYKTGDVVLYDGKQYAAITNTKSIPTKLNSGWRIFSGDIRGYHFSDSVPLSANVGDRWVDKISGRLYTYIEDENGFHWVEF